MAESTPISIPTPTHSHSQVSSKAMLELAYQTVLSIEDDNAVSFAAGFPDVNDLSLRHLETSLLPVVNAILLLGDVSDNTAALVAAIKNTCALQAWRQPYAEKEVGSDFTHGSAWFPIADIDGPVVYTEGLIEIMLLDRGITYPKHSHGPEELYIVLAGRVWWEADDAADSGIWKQAGSVIHHRPHQAHMIRAGDEAVLILSLWRGGSFEMPSLI